MPKTFENYLENFLKVSYGKPGEPMQGVINHFDLLAFPRPGHSVRVLENGGKYVMVGRFIFGKRRYLSKINYEITIMY